jgi:hypothetical protein
VFSEDLFYDYVTRDDGAEKKFLQGIFWVYFCFKWNLYSRSVSNKNMELCGRQSNEEWSWDDAMVHCILVLYRETDKQTKRWTDTWTDRQTDRRTDRVSYLVTLVSGSKPFGLGGGGLNSTMFSIISKRLLMSLAFFWIWFTNDSNLPIA